jgi:hypothetical protein
MGSLRFAKEKKSGNYFIVGHNDEELYVVAELLLNTDARIAARDLLESVEAHSAKSGPFAFKKHPYNLIDIKFFKKGEKLDEDNPLEIDIDSVMLEDLIDWWEDYMLSRPVELFLSRRHDSDIIKLSHENLEE